jgi:hypothetical protein
MRMNWRSHLLLLICIPLLLLAMAATYYRFIIAQDYIVQYEGICDPVSENCFTYCEDEACAEPSYYVKVTKTAMNAYKQCGEDVSDCEIANQCQFGEKDCTVEYCSTDAVEQDEFCTGPEDGMSEQTP